MEGAAGRSLIPGFGLLLAPLARAQTPPPEAPAAQPTAPAPAAPAAASTQPEVVIKACSEGCFLSSSAKAFLIRFLERALPMNLVPNRDVGLQLHGEGGAAEGDRIPEDVFLSRFQVSW